MLVFSLRNDELSSWKKKGEVFPIYAITAYKGE
jgi:hypothetical protein